MDAPVRQLYRRGDDEPSAAPLDRAALSELYHHPAGSGYLRTNFVATLDGAAAGPDGRSGSINTADDRGVFALLRAHADVILVGAGTARTEHYRAVDLEPWQQDLRTDQGLSRWPTLAVLTRSLAVEPSIATPRGAVPGGPVVVLTDNRDADRGPLQDVGVEVITLDGPDVAARAVDALVDRGLPRILSEGGAVLNRQLLAAGRVDDVCLTLAPTMIGGAMGRIVTGELLGRGIGCRLEHCLLGEDDTLITRWSIAHRAPTG